MIEPLLYLGSLGGDRKVRVTNSFHFPRALAQSRIKGRAVTGMAGIIVGLRSHRSAKEQSQSKWVNAGHTSFEATMHGPPVNCTENRI